MTDASRWIEALHLRKHPEGGWFREVYRADETVAQRSLPSRYTGDRSFSTAIYFLLEGPDVSAFHRIRQDEVWHFYDGTGLTLHIIDSAGHYSTVPLGRDVDAGEQLVVVVSAGWLFGATVDADGYALAGCTVAPGFEFEDFEMPTRDALLGEYPRYRDIIERLTARMPSRTR